MNSADLLEAIRDLFHEHGLSAHIGKEILTVQDGLEIHVEPFPHAHPSPDNVMLQLDIVAKSPRLGRATLIDSFAGVGNSVEAAQKNAFGKFLMGSFHVIAEALTTHACASGQVEWKQWHGPHNSWRVCSGPLLALSSGDSSLPSGYSAVLDELGDLFMRTVPPGPHWVRVFVAALNGRVVSNEAVLDGEPWRDAELLISSHDWTVASAGYESIRHLVISLPM